MDNFSLPEISERRSRELLVTRKQNHSHERLNPRDSGNKLIIQLKSSRENSDNSAPSSSKTLNVIVKSGNAAPRFNVHQLAQFAASRANSFDQVLVAKRSI